MALPTLDSLYLVKAGTRSTWWGRQATFAYKSPTSTPMALPDISKTPLQVLSHGDLIAKYSPCECPVRTGMFRSEDRYRSLSWLGGRQRGNRDQPRNVWSGSFVEAVRHEPV